jgi:hypothetical protein
MVIPGPNGEDADGPERSKRKFLNWDLLFDFHAMVEELKATDGIVDVRSQMHDPVPNFTIETIEHGLGVVVPDHIKSFYRVSDGLEFSWSYERDGEVVRGGGAHLFDFATVFDKWLDTLWGGDEEATDDEQDFWWSLRGFDEQCHPDTREMVVLCVEEDYPTYDLFVHDLDERTSRLLDLSFREYFDLLLVSRGTYGWRDLLTEDVDPDDPRAEEFFEVADRFFPEADLSPWGR